jgi:acylglycerol lipase
MERRGEEKMPWISEAGSFPGLDRVMLYEQWWRPEQEPKAGIVLVHGLAEHSGRYLSVVDHLSQHGYAVDTFDLRGHGKSNGVPILVNSFDDYLTDLDVFLDRVRARLPGKPLFLLGHSMGGAITALFAICHQPQVRGIILSAPSVKISSDVSPILQKASSALACILPRLKTMKIKHRHISRDPAVVEAYDGDPLVYRKGILLKTGSELVKATKRIRSRAQEFSLPVLILQGTRDKLADPDINKWFYETISSSDRTLKLYEGLYHEVMNEPEKEQVLQDIITWLDAHVRCGDR